MVPRADHPADRPVPGASGPVGHQLGALPQQADEERLAGADQHQAPVSQGGDRQEDMHVARAVQPGEREGEKGPGGRHRVRAQVVRLSAAVLPQRSIAVRVAVAAAAGQQLFVVAAGGRRQGVVRRRLRTEPIRRRKPTVPMESDVRGQFGGGQRREQPGRLRGGQRAGVVHDARVGGRQLPQPGADRRRAGTAVVVAVVPAVPLRPDDAGERRLFGRRRRRRRVRQRQENDARADVAGRPAAGRVQHVLGLRGRADAESEGRQDAAADGPPGHRAGAVQVRDEAAGADEGRAAARAAGHGGGDHVQVHLAVARQQRLGATVVGRQRTVAAESGSFRGLCRYNLHIFRKIIILSRQ